VPLINRIQILHFFFIIFATKIKKMSAIKISNIIYKGWKNTIEISNLDIKVLVVPEIGRIMYYGFLDGQNIFYENEQLEGIQFNTGEYYKEKDIKKAPNLGGNRVLPCSEEYFDRLTGSRHLPDPFINASVYETILLKNGVLLISPLSELLGIQIERSITISENGTGVTIEQKLIKKIAAKNAILEKIPLTIWSLSKIKIPNISYLPIDSNSIFNAGFFISKWPDAKNNADINTFVNNGVLELKSSEDLPQKVGADSKNWVAGYVDDSLFIEEFNFDTQTLYPDGGTSVTLFGNSVFSELECLSPEKNLRIGESICYDLHWSLLKVKDKKEVYSILQGLKETNYEPSF